MRLDPSQVPSQSRDVHEQEEGMAYRMMGALHARLAATWHGERGQGTVEYVALILLVAALLAGVVAATKGTKFGTGQIAETIVKQIRNALVTIK
jgi:hypothetical protein